MKLIIPSFHFFVLDLAKFSGLLQVRLNVKNPNLTSTKTNIYIKTTNSFKTDITHFSFTKKWKDNTQHYKYSFFFWKKTRWDRRSFEEFTQWSKIGKNGGIQMCVIGEWNRIISKGFLSAGPFNAISFRKFFKNIAFSL